MSDNQQTQSDKPLFLYISPARLILLSIVSWGLFEAYWIYKNWNYIKDRDSLEIIPLLRGFFGIFYCHSLLSRIHEDLDANAVQVPTFSARWLATGWLILSIISGLVGFFPGPLEFIISALIPSFLFLVPVQNYINAMTEKRDPGQKMYRWSVGHIVCLVFGILTIAMLLIAPWSFR